MNRIDVVKEEILEALLVTINGRYKVFKTYEISAITNMDEIFIEERMEIYMAEGLIDKVHSCPSCWHITDKGKEYLESTRYGDEAVEVKHPTNDWDRITGFNCASCMYYAPKTDDRGVCRRHAPTLQGYPVVYAKKDWCGDHKIGTNPSKERYKK